MADKDNAFLSFNKKEHTAPWIHSFVLNQISATKVQVQPKRQALEGCKIDKTAE